MAILSIHIALYSCQIITFEQLVDVVLTLDKISSLIIQQQTIPVLTGTRVESSMN